MNNGLFITIEIFMIIGLRKEKTKTGEDESRIKKVVISVTSNKFMRHAFLEAWLTFLKTSRVLQIMAELFHNCW